ncbi:MAG: hypothetical protein R3F61_26380 [Myxococcota bacterium]
MRSLCAVLLASGCVPTYSLSKATTCDADVTAPPGSLAHHVLVGGPGDGTFAYDPPAAHIEAVEGAYDLSTGAFAYTVRYAEGFRSEDRITDGTGTLWRDGDSDLAYDLALVRRDGSEQGFHVRSVRLGCAEDSRFEDAVTGALSYESRVYDPDGYALDRRFDYRGVRVSAVGHVELDGSAQLEMALASGPYALDYTETDDGNGTVRRTFDDRIGIEAVVGSWETDADGTRTDFTRTRDGESPEHWEYAVDPAGDGSGTLTTDDGAACELRFTANRCMQSGCVGLEDGPCFPAVTMDLR